MLLLVADEVTTGDDLRVDEAAEFAEIAVVLGAILIVLEDEVVDVVEGDVQLVKQALALQALVIAQSAGRAGGVWILAVRVRHRAPFLLSQNGLDSEQGGQVWFDSTLL